MNPSSLFRKRDKRKIPKSKEAVALFFFFLYDRLLFEMGPYINPKPDFYDRLLFEMGLYINPKIALHVFYLDSDFTLRSFSTLIRILSSSDLPLPVGLLLTRHIYRKLPVPFDNHAAGHLQIDHITLGYKEVFASGLIFLTEEEMSLVNFTHKFRIKQKIRWLGERWFVRSMS